MVERLVPTSNKDDIVHQDIGRKSNEFPDFDAILFHAGRLAETFKARKEASQAHSKARAIFKSTGVSIGIFDLVEGFSEQEDPKAAIDKFIREALHIAAAFAIVPVGQQVDLFQGPANPLGAMEKAYKDGRARGVMGLSPDDQAYQANTELGQEHLRGWNDGQEVLQERFLAMNKQAAEEEAKKKAKSDAAAKKREDRLAKAKGAGEPPKTEEGQTEQ